MMPDDYNEKDSMALSEDDLPKLRSYKAVQVFFLLRLGLMLRLRQNTPSTYEAGNWHGRMLNKAVYSTYRDCVELGLEDDAHALFSKIAAERTS